jgi:hypothetical protein
VVAIVGPPRGGLVQELVVAGGGHDGVHVDDERSLAEPDGVPVVPGELDLAFPVEGETAGTRVQGHDLAWPDTAGVEHPDLGDQAGGERDGDGMGRPLRRGQAQVEPVGAARGTGATAAATADRPTALGLAKVTSASEIDPTRHRARDPTQRSAVTATSTSALSRASPSTAISSCLACHSSSSPPSRPVATRPVASPATVASRSSGKALLVPVDNAHSGISPQCLATTR